MKKLLLAVTLMMIAISAVSCSSGPTLRLLNWGEYLNDDVITRFEEEYGITIKQTIAASNELFYSKIISNTTAYDLVIPSDYMVEKMVEEELLLPLDYNQIPNRALVTYMDGVVEIYNQMTTTTLARTGHTVDYSEYAVPYFWGTYGIIYNNRVDGLEEALNQYGWEVFFNSTDYFPNASRAMYDVPQDAYATAMIYLGHSPNEYSATFLSDAQTVLEGANFSQWGDDQLKKDVEAGNLDMAFVYTGDFLDRLYIQLDEERTIEEITADFNIYIPDTTIVFIDNMVIPYTATNLDAAHKFINFLLDPEIMALNAESVGYAVPTNEAYDVIVSHIDDTDSFYHNWAYANLTYYNKNAEGTYYPLTSLPSDFVDDITSMIDVVKTSN
ncbi:MAG: extracellular solute-binding protein [Bacilli bacterium]|nr:extracellular solute-binding protein [Bacilli bacterium]MBN2876248.1 extracellular solute-binding protein [Bacilli bacterium]